MSPWVHVHIDKKHLEIIGLIIKYLWRVQEAVFICLNESRSSLESWPNV